MLVCAPAAAVAAAAAAVVVSFYLLFHIVCSTRRESDVWLRWKSFWGEREHLLAHFLSSAWSTTNLFVADDLLTLLNRVISVTSKFNFVYDLNSNNAMTINHSSFAYPFKFVFQCIVDNVRFLIADYLHQKFKEKPRNTLGKILRPTAVNLESKQIRNRVKRNK